MNEVYSDFYRGRKVLVTGGLGFIGANICLRLLDLGAEVTVLDNFAPVTPSIWQKSFLTRIHLVVADIRDVDKVERIVRGQEIIFNLAGKSGAADSNKAPMNDLDINCLGHLTILEACRVLNPETTIVFSSSRLVYGKPCYLPVDESHPLAPESMYAAHKLTAENYHLIYGRLYGLKSTVLRISNPYGPMHASETRAYGVASAFIQAAVKGNRITIFGDGEQRRDYLYINDLVEAFLCAAQAEIARGKIYNIGSGLGASALELANMAISTTGQGEIVRIPWPEDYLAVETGDYLSDVGLACQELGWRAEIELEEGVVRTVDYYCSSL